MPSLEVLYEDNHLLAINKTAGVLVQGDQTGDKPLADICKEYIKKKFNKPGEVYLGVVHRLDRPVSGVIIFARTSKALSRLNALFRDRKTEKVYWAITDRMPKSPEGVLKHWLRKDEAKNKTTVFSRETPDALYAELSYKVLSSRRGRCLLEVYPLTGRSHQIRVQLASMGCAILGDIKYGSTVETGDGSIALHARRLSFIHPVKKEPILLESPPPGSEWWIDFQ
ncbi:MAG: RluA family pseudouridine synthase [Cytophagales bacterium]|nr:RluA family pseudouridine synthase [Cytophagales bacterium]